MRLGMSGSWKVSGDELKRNFLCVCEWEGEGEGEREGERDRVPRTTTSVPTISLGGSTLEPIISATKLAVMPTMAIMQMRDRPRTRTKVFANGAAPYSGTGMLVGLGGVDAGWIMTICSAFRDRRFCIVCVVVVVVVVVVVIPASG